MAGRPKIGAQINIAIPPGMLTRIDGAAAAEGVTRSAWIRQAIAARLYAYDLRSSARSRQPNAPAGARRLAALCYERARLHPAPTSESEEGQ